MDRDPGLPGRTVIATVAISVFLFMLLSLFVVLSWGMDVTNNYELGVLYIYLESTELAGMTPTSMKEHLCRGMLPRGGRETAYAVERRGVVGDARYEVYRRTLPDKDGKSVLQPVIQFTMKECGKESK